MLAVLALIPVDRVVAQSPEAKATLVELLRSHRARWSSGYLEASLLGFTGTAEIKAWWDASGSRREYQLGEDTIEGFRGENPRTLRTHIVGPKSYCRFSAGRGHVYVTERLENRDGLMEHLRVLPNESWLEIVTGKSLEDWVVKSPGAALVVRRPDGGFSALFAKAGDVDLNRFKQAIMSGDSIHNIPVNGDTGRGTHALFDKHGLPIRIEKLGSGDRSGLEVNWEWSDDPVPVLKSLSRDSSRDGGETFKTLYHLKIVTARPRLLENAPSLDIPPSDLPAGTRIVVRGADGTRDQYIVEDQGKAE